MDKLYIPGDLVMVKKSALQFAKDKIFKVISSLSGGFVKVVLLDDSSATYSISKNAVRPIPLTPAILEDNGWEKLDNVHNIPTYEHPETEWFEVMFELDDCKAYCLDSAIVDSFNYVHQLQHLLFGLGLNSEMEV